MERQTNLALDEVLATLKDGKNIRYPRCLLLNELGILCLNHPDINDEGIKCFSQLLDSKSDNEKYISYIFLLLIPGAIEKAKEEVVNFKALKNNKNIILQAETQVMAVKSVDEN